MVSITSYRYFVTNVPEELVKLIHSYCDPETDYYRDKIIGILKNINVGRNGFKLTNYKNEFDSPKSIKNIIDCVNQIPAIIRPLKTSYSVGSYGGKHAIEKHRKDVLKLDGDCYISNGEFIMAMIILGFTVKHCKGLNCIFRAGYVKGGMVFSSC